MASYLQKRFAINIDRIYYSHLQGGKKQTKKCLIKYWLLKYVFLHIKCWLFFCFYLCPKIVLEHTTPVYFGSGGFVVIIVPCPKQVKKP